MSQKIYVRLTTMLSLIQYDISLNISINRFSRSKGFYIFTSIFFCKGNIKCRSQGAAEERETDDEQMLTADFC